MYTNHDIDLVYAPKFHFCIITKFKLVVEMCKKYYICIYKLAKTLFFFNTFIITKN